MKRNLYPNDYVSSVYDIDFDALAREGYRGIIFDVDNTLVPHGAPADQRARDFFGELHALGYRCVLLSNNKEPRVQKFCRDVIYAEYIFKAAKPKPGNYRRAMEMMGTDVTNTLFVGDQIFTDVWGANLAGIRSVLVKPILPWKEEIQIILKRFLEAVVLLGYRVYRRYGDTIRPVPLKERRNSGSTGKQSGL